MDTNAYTSINTFDKLATFDCNKLKWSLNFRKHFEYRRRHLQYFLNYYSLNQLDMVFSKPQSFPYGIFSLSVDIPANKNDEFDK